MKMENGAGCRSERLTVHDLDAPDSDTADIRKGACYGIQWPEA